jgi:hypothetical protein
VLDSVPTDRGRALGECLIRSPLVFRLGGTQPWGIRYSRGTDRHLRCLAIPGRHRTNHPSLRERCAYPLHPAVALIRPMRCQLRTRELSMQNSFPSGSASTTHDSSP